jgi:hypothetical protein
MAGIDEHRISLEKLDQGQEKLRKIGETAEEAMGVPRLEEPCSE